MPERGGPEAFTTISDEQVNRLYTPADLAGFDYERDLGFPGEYPFTRGVHPTMYRSRYWTMRMFAGFGSAEDTNARFRYLLEHGETGLSTAFDFPTLYGVDADDPVAYGEFGKVGVGVSSLADMEVLFDGIPIDQVTTSMTINGPARDGVGVLYRCGREPGHTEERAGRDDPERHPERVYRAEHLYLPA